MNWIFKNQIICLAILFVIVTAHEGCNHDEQMKEFYKNFAKEFKDPFVKPRFLKNLRGDPASAIVELQPLRVTFDTTALNSGMINQSQRMYLISVIKTIVNFLKKFIKVIPGSGNNVFSNGTVTTCFNDVIIPEEDKTIGIPDSDLHLYVVHTTDMASSYIANAGWCAFSSTADTMRPNFGRILFNLGQMSETIGTDKKQYQKDLMITLHEIIHVLGFSSGSMEYWHDKSTGQVYGPNNISNIIATEIIRSIPTKILKSPYVLATARKYYGCETLSGMQLENQVTFQKNTFLLIEVQQELQCKRNHFPVFIFLLWVDNGSSGTYGSHWERTILLSEIMTAAAINEGQKLSVMTVALLKDTGFWDDVNENLSDPIYWGKDKGCNFVEQACNAPKSFEEFSVYGEKGCTFWNDGQGFSTLDEYSDSCYYYVSYSNNLCEDPKIKNHHTNTNIHLSLDDYNYNSKCFVSNLLNPNYSDTYYSNPLRCHQYSCSADQSTITITFSYLPTFSLVCGANEQGAAKTAIYHGSSIGTLSCPSDYKKFCDNQNCKNYCSLNGICIRGICHCNAGYSGDDCTVDCEVYSINGYCVSTCPSETYANPDNSCKATCPNGFYPNSTGNVCSLCDFSCSKCTGPLSTNCTACQFLTYLDDQTCVTICPLGKYMNEITKQCANCPIGCVDCSSETKCGSCQENYTKSRNTCVSILCDKTCNSCNPYPNNSECTSCPTGFFLNYLTKKCVTADSCPEGTHGDFSNNTCNICPTGCTACSSSSLVCSTCNTGLGYRLSGNTCTNCVAPCQTCLPASLSSCITCEEGKYLFQSSCVATCPQGYYEGSNYKCVKCMAGCSSCTTGSECAMCDTSSGYSTYTYNSNQICILSTDCFSPCATCSIANQPEVCATCHSNFVIQGNICQSQCDVGYYAISEVCMKCSDDCYECIEADIACTSCKTPKSLNLNKCVDTCPTDKQSINQICLTKTTFKISNPKLTVSLVILFLALIFL